MTLPIIMEPEAPSDIAGLPDNVIMEMFVSEPQGDLPQWMKDLVANESEDHDIEPPKKMYEKIVDWNPYFGGYTHHLLGEIALVYGGDQPGHNWRGSANEFEGLLHELAHWIIGPEENYWWAGGHSPKFYSKLTELCLKYDCLDCYLYHEFHYMGPSLPYAGLKMYHKMFNAR